MRRSFWIGLVAVMLPMSADADDYRGQYIQPVSNFCPSGGCNVQQPGCWTEQQPICGNPCACCEPPKWIVSGAYLMLQRDLREAPIVTGPGGAPIVVGSNNFDSGYESGFEVAARRALGCDNMVEFRYFQVEDFSDSLSRTTTGTDTISGATLGAALPSTMTYDSSLYNAELNFIMGNPCKKVRLLAGFRYISYDERLTLSIPAAPVTASTKTRNDLYGLQLGGEFDVIRNPCGFYLTGFSKGAIAYGDTRSNVDGAGAFVVGASDNSDVPVYVSEFGVQAGYQLTEHLSIDTSYRGMFLYGVALAGEQASTTAALPAPGTTTINHGDVFFHGFTVGATLTW